MGNQKYKKHSIILVHYYINFHIRQWFRNETKLIYNNKRIRATSADLWIIEGAQDDA